MKISAKLLIITFTVVVSISGISSIIYYLLTNTLLESQYSKLILNSTNDFINYIQPLVKRTDEEAVRLAKDENKTDKNLNGYETDFFFRIMKDSLIDFSSFKVKDTVYLNRSSRSIKEFVKLNRNVIFRATQEKGDVTYFYGKVVNESFLSKIAERIRAEVALAVDDNIYEMSHSSRNKNYYDVVAGAVKKLQFRNNFDIDKEYLEDADFMASVYGSRTLSVAQDKITFIIFNTTTESLQLRSTIKWVLLIMISSGIALALILILLFTTRIRKQISLLNESAEITAKGDLDHRVKVISGDEIGRLGITFNRMLDELKVIKESEKEYLDFLTLLNQSPSVKEIADSVLMKIIKGTGLTFGAVYIVEGKEMSVVSSHGVSSGQVQPVQSANFYSKAIEEREKIEFIFTENFPEIRTGLAYIKIKYLLIFPIVYNKETIAIIEVASETLPQIDVKKYLHNIHDQLAIGIINATSLSQLESYIENLKTLNEEYQKQNVQILGQNEKLLDLHKELKEKAEELEEKRNQAVQLTKVKSQFLANMSHELKTPLISIIGLADLSLKENINDSKVRERLNVIYRNGKKLLNMINNILEFSKFDSGNAEVKNEVFLLNDLLNELKENILPLAKEKKLYFAVKNGAGEALLATDKTLLERILLNLLFNAVKFTDKGNVELDVMPGRKGDVEFTVTDTGIGISEENQKLIFDEFKQVEEGSTKTYGGAGLGLAISKRYAEMLGGGIKVKSTVNKGAKFSVLIPGIIVEIITDSEREIEEKVPADLVKERKGVLLLSQNSGTKKLLQDYLHNYHIMLTHVTSLKELQKVNSKEYDALFVDVDENSKGLWGIFARMRKLNKTIKFLPLRMLEEEKVGFGLFADNYIAGAADSSFISSILGMKHNGGVIENICILRSSPEEADDAIPNGVKTINYTGWDNLSAFIRENKTDALIIELLEPKENSVKLIYRLRKEKAFRKMYIALSIPETIGEATENLLLEEMTGVTLEAKYHPMDVLKVVRDKMQLVNEIENPDLEEIQNEEEAPAEAIQENRKKILLVDDDNDTLFTIGELVTGMGYTVLYAHNGVECLAVLAKEKPDLVLLDIMMPQMDGFETIKRIRMDLSNSGLPVAALTAYEMLDNREVIEKNGFNELITKPIESKSLAFKIEKLLIGGNEKDSDN